MVSGPLSQKALRSLRSRCEGSFTRIDEMLTKALTNSSRRPKFAILDTQTFIEGLSHLKEDRHLDALLEFVASASIAGIHIHGAHPSLLAFTSLEEIRAREKKLISTLMAMEELLPQVLKNLRLFVEERISNLRQYEPSNKKLKNILEE